MNNIGNLLNSIKVRTCVRKIDNLILLTIFANTRQFFKLISGLFAKKANTVGACKQLIDSIWFKQSSLPNDFFNPLNVDLTKFYANSREKITESPVKTIYNECLQFFFDGAEKQTYTQEKGLTFLEKYREGFEKQYSKSTFDKVLVDGNSLVRFNSYCDGALFEFFNIEHRLFITLDIGVGKKFPNPDCKYEFKS